jgi:proteic killer suppression protein
LKIENKPVSLTVTRNWRITFRLNPAGEIEDLDLEDHDQNGEHA